MSVVINIFGCNKKRYVLDSKKLPQHVAVIMDGNGRWARRNGWQRIIGHKQGTDSVRNIIAESIRYNIHYLTLFAFSTENWKRPEKEINELLKIMSEAIDNETNTFKKEGVKISIIGDKSAFSKEIQSQLIKVEEETKANNRIFVNIALNYSGRWEITQTLKNLCVEVLNGKIKIEDINENTISSFLCDNKFPPPDLLIRTSGELRISNFLLWQLAYTELYFTKTLWPAFGKKEYYNALKEYQKRQRRFGDIS